MNYVPAIEVKPGEPIRITPPDGCTFLTWAPTRIGSVADLMPGDIIGGLVVQGIGPDKYTLHDPNGDRGPLAWNTCEMEEFIGSLFDSAEHREVDRCMRSDGFVCLREADLQGAVPGP